MQQQKCSIFPPPPKRGVRPPPIIMGAGKKKAPDDGEEVLLLLLRRRGFWGFGVFWFVFFIFWGFVDFCGCFVWPGQGTQFAHRERSSSIISISVLLSDRSLRA